jgi:hypothetical protein
MLGEIASRRGVRYLGGALPSAIPCTVFASAPAANSSALAWSVLISVLVVAVSVGSAVLPLSAIKHWTGAWQKSAWLPMLILLLWIVTLGLSALGEGLGGRLWALELFIWSMLTMVYMVSAMTIKRIFEKKDQETSPTD